ncbi:WAT1-related protein At5g40240-like isoform X2 [Ziziphus jujuba]|uniref:WAT1-related protein n=1 Tax=Ziziphus jujuba TaxID=326968 RepID=A0ABM4A7Q6_ZIZJJ|nr:WAT1-related protein At5g40240-like isoform X2 [Ziziphus jujuba]
MVWRRCCYGEVVPFAAMAAVECTNVGLNTLFKAATLKGMSYLVFILYSYALGSLILLPLPFIFRRMDLSSFKVSILYRIFILGLIGFSANICAYKGIEYSSPTLASALSNLTPAFTFVLAIILRMENVGLRRTSSHAKIIGTVVSISGALVALLYKGPTLLSSSSPVPSNKPHQYPLALATAQTNWIIGGLLLSAEYFLLSIWYIIQTQVIKIYPDELSVTLVYLLCTTIIAAPICILAETNSSAWRLGPDISLVTIIFSLFWVSCSWVMISILEVFLEQ